MLQLTKTNTYMSQVTLFVGNHDVAGLLKSTFKEHDINAISIEPDPQLQENGTLFGRDWRVVRHDGSHLIPYSNGISHLGCGFERRMQIQALDTCKKHRIPYQLGKTMIEGGNCKLFIGKDGTRKAIFLI